MSALDTPTKMPVDRNGNPVPVLRPVYGAGQSLAVSAVSSAAVEVHNGNDPRVVRLSAIGQAVYFTAGGSDVGAATTANGAYIFADSYLEVALDKTETHIRAIAPGGAGTLRIEPLR